MKINNIKIVKITKVSPQIITKEGKKIYFVDFEGSFFTEQKEEVNTAIQEAIERLEQVKLK